MHTSKLQTLVIRSGTELVLNPVPDIPYRILGLLRANGGRMSLTGPYKARKSLLTQDLSFRVAAEDDWLGFKTMQGKVLYVNLEISSEKFQERTQDIQNALQSDERTLNRFREVTILDRNLKLDTSIKAMQSILNVCAREGFKVDMLMLDPRARCISGSENEEVIIKHFCDNVDTLLANNPGLSVVIVTHMGKDPTKGAIGHSRYSAWLDTEIRIIQTPKPNITELEIIGRDVENAKIKLDFTYPLHKVVEEEQFVRETKVDEAKTYILACLAACVRSEQKLRLSARKKGHTDYAFHTAIRELKDEKRIKSVQAKGRGNRKLLKLIKEDD